MKTTIAALALVCASFHCVAADAPKPTDQASIQGTWLAQTESQGGQKKKVDFQYVFKGDRLAFKDETGKEIKYSFKLDTTNKPNLLVIQPAESPTSSTPVSVAYALEGDSLTIVVAAPGTLPTDISDKNGQELILCRRKSP
ncbi:MAG: TIGR03067 domain-containing protein [Verrucomicrobiota bacterium]